MKCPWRCLQRRLAKDTPKLVVWCACWLGGGQLLGGSDRQAACWVSKHVRHEDEALTICRVNTEVIDKLGDPVTRDGVVAQRDVDGTLLHALRQHGWGGSIHIRNCPFHFLDIRTGKREFLR